MKLFFCDVRFDDEISAQLPLARFYIENVNSYLLSLGIKVSNLSGPSFVRQFYKVKCKGNKCGEIYGFPYTCGAWCVDRLKTSVMRSYFSFLVRELTNRFESGFIPKQRLSRSSSMNSLRLK